jgi:hypothetical protein
VTEKKTVEDVDRLADVLAEVCARAPSREAPGARHR